MADDVRAAESAFIVTIPARPLPTQVTTLPSPCLNSPRRSRGRLPAFFRHRRSHLSHASMTASDDNKPASDAPDTPDNSDDDISSGMNVFRKPSRRPSNGDVLPFDVSIVSPPPSYLGRFKLDPHTNCGDVVEHDGMHFVVKKVRMQYKYSAGAYKMVRKTIEVKSLARKALDSYLERVLRDS
ncbi:unnamed protein product [Chondrus crispus]|uniref:Uncharacterized protein n=1 Tax=Chondrus crispus TaxID=2769 RepID=R7QPR1_CHOCR|nr:unnamed protein product [Chondrus crispus]CDF39466.1 unnamed protein product [Chondrus crispus]|eukprot:XP_005719377.1 unnamed protein product [Chondrus crispus]